MAPRKTPRICLGCSNYRPIDNETGKCRVGRSRLEPSAYPVMRHRDSCDLWQDAGQQYHIRVGWLRGLNNDGATGQGR